MSSNVLHVLQVEDSASDAALSIRVLEKAGYEIHSERVEEAAEMRSALAANSWDLIIADYRLPQFDAAAALRVLQESGQDIPFIIVSGTIGEDVAVGMMKSGAHDYLLKQNLARLVPAVERELREAWVRRERLQAERALRRQTELVNLSHDAIITADANRVITGWNAGAQEMYGWTENEVVGQVIGSLFHTECSLSVGELDEILKREGRWDGELIHTGRNGQKLIVESRQVLLRDPQGAPVGVLEINRDITERKRTEERLREAERAESIALLAGGIAHDFNNILTAVSGNISIALEDLCPDCQVGSVLTIALESVQRAASLTRQLLAYSGKGAFVRRPVSVSEVAKEAIHLAKPSIPKNVEIHTELPAELPSISTDPSQMQLVFTNLILNGVEAIGEKRTGQVTVRTSQEEDGVRVEVSDTGCGMDAETQKRIFDPFFTTKFVGRGLGLAAVQGIVKAMNGKIAVESEPGRGTSVRIVLPFIKTPAAPLKPGRRPEVDRKSNTGGVLIVDDEPAIRKVAAALLNKRGIAVFEAATGQQAIDCLTAHSHEIRAVLLDMTMPDLNGYEALPTIRKIRPGIHVIVSSGYSDVEVKQQFSDMQVDGMLPKPYSGEQLLEHVLAALDHS